MGHARQNLCFKIFLSNSFQIHLYLKFITLKKGYPKNRLIVIPRSKSHISCQFPNYTIVDIEKQKQKQREGMKSCTTYVVEKVRQSR